MSNTALARPGGNAVAAQDGTPTLADLVKRKTKQLQQIAAENMDVQRLYRIVLQCIAKTPELRKCSLDSVMRAMMDAAEVGLEPGGVMGLSYLVPYGQECQFIIGYRGYIELARRSGLVMAIEVKAVYEGDEFEYEDGLNPVLRHKPGQGARTDDKLTHVYAIARYVNGYAQPEIMTKPEVDMIRTRSKARGGPWVTDYAEMAKKTVIRRLCKKLPRSIQMQKAFSVEDRNETHLTSASPLSIVAGGEDDFLDSEFANVGSENTSAASAPIGGAADDDLEAHGSPEDE